jgi:hypothetical protein
VYGYFPQTKVLIVHIKLLMKGWKLLPIWWDQLTMQTWFCLGSQGYVNPPMK